VGPGRGGTRCQQLGAGESKKERGRAAVGR
jgi:hypothetical protein